MDFSKSYCLENNRVRLVPLERKHLNFLSPIAKESDLWTFFIGRSNGENNFSEYIRDAIESRNQQKEYPFAVYDKMQNAYAGSTRLFDFNNELKSIRLGFTWYGKAFRGSGLNKNCKYLLFEFLFEKLNLIRVGLGAHAENKTSIYAMESVGCKKEGELRDFFPPIHKSERANAVMMSLLKTEWHSGVKNELKHKL